jgi:septal ring factor EnvC (AmiA/AmiB activator)
MAGHFILAGLLVASVKAGATVKAAVKSERLAREFQSTKVSLMNDEIKQRKILGALFELNHKMKKVVSEKAEMEQEKLIVEESIHELVDKINELEAKNKIQKALLRERLAAIYKLGGPGVARVLFSSSSSAELERNLKILGIIAQKDLELIKDYGRTMKDLEYRKQKRTQRWAHLKQLEQKIKNKEQNLANDNAIKNKILKNIKSSQAFALKKLNTIRKKSQQLAAEDDSGLLDLLFQPSFFEQKGQLPKPLQGPLVQGFGLLKDETHKVVLSHKGHFYSAKVGTPVKAVFSGKVAYAGEVPGFGQTLILDHGDHYYSVYSHNKALQAHMGDEVAQSQTLALSGTSQSEFGEGLYFEIRHFSEPADPKLWMKGTL